MNARPMQAALLSWLLDLPIPEVHKAVRTLGLPSWERTARTYVSLSAMSRVAYHLGFSVEVRPCSALDWESSQGIVLGRYGKRPETVHGHYADFWGVRDARLWYPEDTFPRTPFHPFCANSRREVEAFASEQMQGVRFTSFLRLIGERA